MIWIYILAPLLAIIVWLLLATLYIRVSTVNNTYTVGLKGFFKISLLPDEKEYIIIRIRIVGFNSVFYPLKPIEKKTRKKKKKKIKVRKNKMTGLFVFRYFLKLAISAIRSWKIKSLKINIDTGDVIKNAYLIPIFVGVNVKKNINFTVNYQSEMNLEVDVENNLFRILKVVLLAYFKYKIFIRHGNKFRRNTQQGH
ncbi:MAG: hypothetical protein R2764_16110 [Bacteroidales bacterium]